MAYRSKKNDGTEGLVLLVGVLLFLPFLLVSCVAFGAFKGKYLANEDSQRVMDIKRVPPIFIAGGSVLLGGGFIAMMAFSYGGKVAFIGFLIALGALCAGFVIAMRIAALYLGIIGDKGQDKLFFPYDMQSYGVEDYLTLSALRDYCSIDSVDLSSITKMTRGRGKELYVHGDFGSRGIIMSSKQKRDECLAMIQDLTGKRGLLIGEIESY